MKGAVVIFTSQKDPNGLSQTRQNVLYMLENIKQDLKIIIASEDTKNLIDDLPSGSHERVVAINGNYKNYNQAILTLREMGILDVDLLFLPTPGDYVQIDDHTVTNYI